LLSGVNTATRAADALQTSDYTACARGVRLHISGDDATLFVRALAIHNFETINKAFFFQNLGNRCLNFRATASLHLDDRPLQHYEYGSAYQQ
jgi:hypothetical protein